MSKQMPSVFIAGGRGRVGDIVVKLLRSQGYAVTALMRSLPDRKLKKEAEEMAKSGVAILYADLSDRDSVKAVLSGQTADYYIGTAASIDTSLAPGYEAILQHAKKTGGQHFVYLNCSARFEPLLPAFVFMDQIIDLIGNSGIPSTILDCDLFANSIADFFQRRIRRQEKTPFYSRDSSIAGTGEHSFLDEDNVLPQLIVAILGDPMTFGRYTIGGPETLSLRELLRRYNEVNGTALESEVLSFYPGLLPAQLDLYDQWDRYSSRERGCVLMDILGIPQIPLNETLKRH